MVSTSSFRPTDMDDPVVSEGTQVLLFPSFISLRTTPSHSVVDQFVRGYLLPNGDATITNAPSWSGSQAHKTQSQITQPTILICSHNTRDSRCGVLGPLLRDEFSKYLSSQRFSVYTEHFSSGPTIIDKNPMSSPSSINLGLISHIGGHKWAGNVILYIPPDWKAVTSDHTGPNEQTSPLAGMGIWYGRVEPKHVPGIVDETLIRGNVIRDLFRGGIARDGRILRL